MKTRIRELSENAEIKENPAIEESAEAELKEIESAAELKETTAEVAITEEKVNKGEQAE